MFVFYTNDYPDYKQEDCGTVMCIAGAVMQFNDLLAGSTSGIAELIGMTEKQKCMLFFGTEKALSKEGSAMP